MKTKKYTLKQVPFYQERIEVCRNCGGSGYVIDGDFQHVECEICGGSGRIKKTVQGTINIAPYEND